MQALTRIAHHDVVVVGARCAGSATARLLAARGHDVAVLDRALLPSDTLSTHAIARTGVVQLARWDLLDTVVAAGTPPIREVRFHSAAGTISRQVKDRFGVDFVVAPRRTVLDAILADSASAAGAHLRTGITVKGVRRRSDGRVVGVHGTDRRGHPVEVRARYVVGADGLRSVIARSVDAPLRQAESSEGATHYAYFAGDWPAMEYYLGDRSFAGIFPTNDGQACLWACLPADDAEAVRRASDTPEDALATMIERASTELASRMRSARPCSPVRGMMRLPNQVRGAAGDGWALVGDAGYHRDAITGHGISDAFRDAELLATALDQALRGADDPAAALARYEAQRDEMLSEIFSLTVALAGFPPADRFVELQKQLGQAIDAQAGVLAGWADLDPLALAA